MLIESGIVAVCFLEVGGEVVDIGFEVGAAGPGSVDDSLEFVDVVAGLLVDLESVLLGDVKLLAEGLDGGLQVVGRRVGRRGPCVDFAVVTATAIAVVG